MLSDRFINKYTEEIVSSVDIASLEERDDEMEVFSVPIYRYTTCIKCYNENRKVVCCIPLLVFLNDYRPYGSLNDDMFNTLNKINGDAVPQDSLAVTGIPEPSGER